MTNIDTMTTLSKKKIPEKFLSFCFTFFSLLIIISPSTAWSASNSWTIPSPVSLGAYAMGDYCVRFCDDDPMNEPQTMFAYISAGHISNLTASITYRGTVKNNTTGVTSDTVLVKVGDSISFLPTTPASSDISWSGTGGTNDTPSGSWTSSRSIACNGTTQIFYATGYPTAQYWGYLNLNVDPVSPTIAKSGAATLSCDSDGFNCTVTGAGTINATITWPATSGHFNYRYSKSGSVAPGGDWLRGGTCLTAILDDNFTNGNDPYDLTPPTEYKLAIPTKSVFFSLTATAAPKVNLYFSILDTLKNFFSSFLPENFKVFAGVR